jgi:two-component system cell cycle sensor histidine kinase/response regulator CckA
MHACQAVPAPETASFPNTTVLIVEDEELVRFAVSKQLGKLGFSVIEARGGSEAIDLIATHVGDIHFMLLDVTLPDIPSRKVFEEARRMRPDIRVVLTSAYPRKTAEASFAGLQMERFIQKPYPIEELANLLRNTPL